MTLAGFVPWPEADAERYRRSGLWAGVTLGAALERSVRLHHERIAVVDGERRLTYGELGARVARLARAMAARGICDGERVVMQMPNCLEFVVAYFAALQVGAIPIACMPHHRRVEIEAIAGAAEASAWIFASKHRGFDFVSFCEELRPALPKMREAWVVGDAVGRGMTPLDELLDRPDAGEPLEPHAPRASAPAMLQLSGGTTGVPKLIPRTHDDYLYNSLEYARVSGFGADDVLLVAVPIAHNFPLRCVQGALFAGGRVVLARSPSPEVVLPAIERERVTYMPAVPATLIEWANAARPSHDLRSLRAIYVGGQKLKPEAAKLASSVLGPVIRQSFGMAEGLECCTRPEDGPSIHLETQGRPISAADETRIVGDDDELVPEGEVGELLCRGPYTIRGYFRAEEHNARAFTRDGFYRTGDMVRAHPSGNFVVEGRKKDLINRGGEKISAEEIENHLLAHPSVANVAIVAVPDPVLGERACACVVVKSGCAVTLGELTRFLVEDIRISPAKVPERLDVRDSLPATGVGKVSKAALREELRRRIDAERGDAGALEGR